MMDEIKKALFEDHIRELRKYKLGELLRAIDEQHCVTLKFVGRYELLSLPDESNKKRSPLDRAIGGPAVAIIFREGNLAKEDVGSLKEAFPEAWGKMGEH